jgi:hypothetical protein
MKQRAEDTEFVQYFNEISLQTAFQSAIQTVVMVLL